MKRTIAERVIEADQMGEHWKYLGNRAMERGNLEMAERHYARVEKWMDKSNRLRGNGDGE